MLSAVSLPLSAARQSGPIDAALPASSPSHPAGAFAPLVNPVFSDVSDASSLSYYQSRLYAESGANHLLALNAFGFSFSCAWLERAYSEERDEAIKLDTTLYSIGKGFFFVNTVGLGASYSFSRSADPLQREYRAWNVGALFRPANFLSLAYVGRDLGSPEFNGQELPRTDIYSVSIRPFPPHLTLSFDYLRQSGAGFHDSSYQLSAGLMFSNGIHVQAMTGSGREWGFGLGIPLDLSRGGEMTFIAEYYGTSPSRGPFSSFGGLTVTGERFRSPLIHSREILKIRIDGAIQEISTERIWGNPPVAFHDILHAIDTAAGDPRIAGIILDIDEAKVGFARVQELRDGIRRFRATGRKVFAFLTKSGNAEYYLASAADTIYFNPTEMFGITGLRAEVYFLRTLLDRVGIKFDSVRRGRYKFFNETFTSRRMSPEYRQSILELISNLNAQFVNDIARDRRIGVSVIEALFREGMLAPGDARTAGFIDVLEYPGPAEEAITTSAIPRSIVVTLDRYLDRDYRNDRWGPVPKIAVIHATGSIVKGKSGRPGSFSPSRIGDETYREMVARAFGDNSVRAVVIRIDSGGGSASASEMMRQCLLEYKKKNPRPVVFSFGNTAASGGYYIATTGDTVFSEKGGITGSIGVVAGKVSLAGLYEKLGIAKDVVKMSEFADIFTESRDLTPAERRLIERNIAFTYRRFTGVVMEGRRIDAKEIDAVAEGRVFSGEQAKGKKLIDREGGLIAAIEYAKLLAGVAGECGIEHIPTRRVSLPAMILQSVFSASPAEELPETLRAALPAIRDMELLFGRGESALYLFPYRIVVR